MHLLLLIVIFTSLGGVLSLLLAAVFLLLSTPLQNKLLPHGVSFATGALLAVAFAGLIPQAYTTIAPSHFQALSGTILAGILAFFVLEKLLLWRHCHAISCEAHGDTHNHRSTGTLIIVGDSLHNFIDGVLIAAAFLLDTKLGIITAIAVAAHEIPQELGDFAILLASGYSRSRALLFNVLSSFATIAGGVIAYYFLQDLQETLPFLLGLAASSFIYIAIADLIPSLHKKTDLASSCQQILLITFGIAVIILLHQVVGHEATASDDFSHQH